MKRSPTQRYPLRKKSLGKVVKGQDGRLSRQVSKRTVNGESTNDPSKTMQVKDDALSINKRTKWIPISTLTSKVATKDSNLLLRPKSATSYTIKSIQIPQSKQALNINLMKKHASIVPKLVNRPKTAVVDDIGIDKINTKDSIKLVRPKTASTHLVRLKRPLNKYLDKKNASMDNQSEAPIENTLGTVVQSTVAEDRIIKEENEEEVEETDGIDSSDWIFLVQVDSHINVEKQRHKDRNKRNLMKPTQNSNDETLKELLIEKESLATRNLRLKAERNLLRQKNTNLKKEYINKMKAFLKNKFILTRIEGALQCMKVRIDGCLRRSCRIATEEYSKENYNENMWDLNK